MFQQILSIAALFSTGAIAWKWGGLDERLAAMAFAFAAFGTPLVMEAQYGRAEIGVLLVDAALLVGLVMIALRSDRFWPLWAAAFQLVGTVVHFASMAESGNFAKAYGNAVVFWGYMVLGTLMVGTWLEARKRQPRSMW